MQEKFRPFKVLTLFFLVVVGLVLTPLPMAAASDKPGPVAARAAALVGYQVTITGTASGNPFTISGLMAIAPTVTVATTNGVNPVEVCLKAGNPATQPAAGAIQYGSNSACFRSRGANIDMVYAGLSDSLKYTTVPDSRLQATFLNHWTNRSGVTACIYSPVDGRTSYTFTETAVTGTIALQGFAGAGCGSSSYVASITGRRVA